MSPNCETNISFYVHVGYMQPQFLGSTYPVLYPVCVHLNALWRIGLRQWVAVSAIYINNVWDIDYTVLSNRILARATPEISLGIHVAPVVSTRRITIVPVTRHPVSRYINLHRVLT